MADRQHCHCPLVQVGMEPVRLEQMAVEEQLSGVLQKVPEQLPVLQQDRQVLQPMPIHH